MSSSRASEQVLKRKAPPRASSGVKKLKLEPPRFSIRPSTVLKDPAMARLTNKGGSTDVELRTSAASYKAKQLSQVDDAIHLRVAAEKRFHNRLAYEGQILSEAAKEGLQWTCLDPRFAIVLANSTRDVLSAEREVLQMRVYELEQHLVTARDEEEDILARIQEAEDQLTNLVTVCQEREIDIKKVQVVFHDVPRPDTPFIKPSSADHENL